MEPIRYVTSLLTFYLKGEIAAEQNFIRFKEPNTILGLIPLGAKKENIPVTQIASVQSNMRVKFLKLVVGVIVSILALSLFKDSFLGGLIILLIGLNVVLDAFEIDLDISTTSGQIKSIDFFIFDKSKADLAVDQINSIIANRLSDTNNREQTDRIVDAINRNH